MELRRELSGYSLSPQIWLEHIEAWKQSGLSQAQYCRTHNISSKSFYYWKCKAHHASAPATTVRATTSGFAVAQLETVVTTHQGLSITLPDGITLSDIHASNVHVAAQLLEVLR